MIRSIHYNLFNKGGVCMMVRRIVVMLGFTAFVANSAYSMCAIAQACLVSCCATCCAQFIANLSTSLVQSTWKQDERGVRRALNRGADPNYFDDETGYTPLAIACEKGNVQIIQILVHRGAHVNFVIPAPEQPSRPLSDESGAPLALRSYQQKWAGYTPLQIAAAMGNLACMKELIELGADAAVTTPDGKTIKNLYEESQRGTNFETLEQRL